MENKMHSLNMSGLQSVSELPLESLESVVWAVGAPLLQCVHRDPLKFVFQWSTQNKFDPLLFILGKAWGGGGDQ